MHQISHRRRMLRKALLRLFTITTSYHSQLLPVESPTARLSKFNRPKVVRLVIFNNQKHPSNSTTRRQVSVFRNGAILCILPSSTCNTAQNLQASLDRRLNKHKISVLTNQNCTVAGAWEPYQAALCSCRSPWSRKIICSSTTPNNRSSSKGHHSRTPWLAPLQQTVNSKVEHQATRVVICCWVEAHHLTATTLQPSQQTLQALSARSSMLLTRAEEHITPKTIRFENIQLDFSFLYLCYFSFYIFSQT